MKLFPTERARQRADTRIVRAFYAVMAVVTALFGVIVGVHYLFGLW